MADFTAHSINLFEDRCLENCLSLWKEVGFLLNLLVTDCLPLLGAVDQGSVGLGTDSVPRPF